MSVQNQYSLVSLPLLLITIIFPLTYHPLQNNSQNYPRQAPQRGRRFDEYNYSNFVPQSPASYMPPVMDDRLLYQDPNNMYENFMNDSKLEHQPLGQHPMRQSMNRFGERALQSSRHMEPHSPKSVTRRTMRSGSNMMTHSAPMNQGPPPELPDPQYLMMLKMLDPDIDMVAFTPLILGQNC